MRLARSPSSPAWATPGRLHLHTSRDGKLPIYHAHRDPESVLGKGSLQATSGAPVSPAPPQGPSRVPGAPWARSGSLAAGTHRRPRGPGQQRRWR